VPFERVAILFTAAPAQIIESGNFESISLPL